MDNSLIIQQVIDGQRDLGLLKGNCREVIKKIPDDSIDCVITSPPYWQLREYDISEETDHLIGAEKTPEEYVDHVTEVFKQIKRILKKTGSVWLNLGDKYHNKNLMGMP